MNFDESRSAMTFLSATRTPPVIHGALSKPVAPAKSDAIAHPETLSNSARDSACRAASSPPTVGTTQTFTSASISWARWILTVYRPSSLSGPFSRTWSCVMVTLLRFKALTMSCGADRAVEVAFVVGVGLDRHALAAQLVGLDAETGQAGLFDLLELGAMLVDHPLVVVGGIGRQALRQQVVQGVAGLDRHHVALLAQVIDRLHQQQLDAAVGRLGQSLVPSLLEACFRHDVLRCLLLVRCCC